MNASRLVPLLLAALLLLGLLVAFGRPLSRAMLYPGSPAAVPSAAELLRLPADARRTEYGAPGGPRLVGLYLPPPDAGAPVAVYFHGNAESAVLNLPLAMALHERGIGVFLAEYRGFGGCPGRPTEEGLYADGEAAVDWVLAQGVAPARVALVGRSLGSGVAVEVALRREPARLVLVSAYTSIVDMGRLVVGPLSPLVVADRFDSLGKLARVAAPVTLIHGGRDEVVPVEMGRRLARVCPDARYLEVPGASHNDFPGLASLLAEAIRGDTEAVR